MLQRKIYISLSLLRDNRQYKDVLEALAFAIMIKRTFVSSTFRNATARRIKSTFHLGSDKVNRVVNDAIKYGFVERVGANLIAKELKQKNNLNVQYVFNHTDKTFVADIECDVKLKDVVKWLKEQVILNHINVQNRMVNAYKRQVDPSSDKEYKKGKRRGKLLYGMYTTLSLAKVSELLKSSRYTSRLLLRALRTEGSISMRETIIPTTINLNDFTKSAQTWLKENGERGFFFANRKEGVVYLRTANTYTCEKNNVCFVGVPEF